MGAIFLIIVAILLAYIIIVIIKRTPPNCESFDYKRKTINRLYSFFMENIDKFYYVPSESMRNYLYFYLNDKFGNPRYMAFISIRSRNCSIFVAPNENSHSKKNYIVTIFEKEQEENLYNNLIKKVN